MLISSVLFYRNILAQKALQKDLPKMPFYFTKFGFGNRFLKKVSLWIWQRS